MHRTDICVFDNYVWCVHQNTLIKLIYNKNSSMKEVDLLIK